MTTITTWYADPPPVSPYSLVQWAFNHSWGVAQQKSTTSDALFGKALAGVGTPPTVSATPFQFTPGVVEPVVNIPKQAEVASTAKFYELSNAVIEQLTSKFSEYITTYFPDESGIMQAAQEWLGKAMRDGGTGIPAAVEAQIWQRDRDRIIAEMHRADEENVAIWAARRYPLPPGVATHHSLMLQKEAADKTAESSRAVAIKQAEMEVENVRFAVEASIKLYASAMGAAVAYIQALSVGPQVGMQLIPSITDSQAKLISAANEYYRSRIMVEELRLKASMPAAEWDQQARITNSGNAMKAIEARVSAAVEAAKALSTQAAAALNGLHASTSTSAGSSNSVGYSYSNDTGSAGPTPSWA